ncbi:MAG: HAMP domain-containing sensor histidine kinase [Kiloniellales bacterium]
MAEDSLPAAESQPYGEPEMASRASAGGPVAVSSFLALAALVAGAAFAADLLLMPSGIAGGLAYLGLVLLGWRLNQARAILLLAVLASGLMAAGHIAAGGATTDAAIVNRGLALLVIWAAAVVLAAAKRREALLAERIAEQNAKLAATRIHAQLANQTTSEFLSNMSHELRTPLNAILGFSEIVRHEMFGPLGNERYRGYMTDIHNSGQRLLDLVNDLLAIAKIEAGRVELAENVVDATNLVRHCASVARTQARTKHVMIEVDIPGGLPPLNADQRKLRQILGNLLANAVRFTPAGGRVRISAWCRPETGHVFQIADTGTGIALKDVPLALAPFGQVGSPLHEDQEGVGLGLPLAKALVELHAGSFDLQSEPGAGTTVTVRFPAERVVSVVEAA